MRYFLTPVLYIEEKEVIYEYILIEVIMTKINKKATDYRLPNIINHVELSQYQSILSLFLHHVVYHLSIYAKWL